MNSKSDNVNEIVPVQLEDDLPKKFISYKEIIAKQVDYSKVNDKTISNK